MFAVDKQLDKDLAWQKRGKKYKTKYFDGLKKLFGEIDDDKDCHDGSIQAPYRGSRTGSIGSLDEETGY